MARGRKQTAEEGEESQESVFIANRHVIKQVEQRCLTSPALLFHSGFQRALVPELGQYPAAAPELFIL